MKISIKVLLIASSLALSGCIESSFELSQDSRLPKWFSVPEGLSRNDVKVTLDYFTDGNAIFKLYVKDDFFHTNKVTGITRGSQPIQLKNPPPGFPKNYPKFQVINVNGINDIIEHKKMEPIFYVTDEMSIWNELIP